MSSRNEFANFYDETSGRIYKFGWLLAGHDGEDLAAEAYARALSKWGTVSGLKYPEAWVRKVLINLAISRGRRLTSATKAMAKLGDRGAAPSHDERVHDRTLLLDAVGKLSPKQRAAVILHYYAGLTLKELAQSLGCTTSTAGKHLARAHKALSQELGTHYDRGARSRYSKA